MTLGKTKMKFSEGKASNSGMHLKTCQHLSCTSLISMKIKI